MGQFMGHCCISLNIRELAVIFSGNIDIASVEGAEV
jgi:hypothetical protein